MAIVSDIVYAALRKIGIRDTSNTTRMAEALSCFNNMLSSWHESIIVPTSESFTLTVGDAEYTIGSGGDFNTVRPTKIISAYIRSTDNYDYPVDCYTSRQDYDRIAEKNLDGRPSNLLYVLEYPLGKIYFDSEPESAETFYLTSVKPYAAYTTLADTILQPVEYENAMIYNLAVELAPEYNQIAPNTVIEMAVILKNDITNRNAQPVPEVEFPSEILR